MKEFKKLGYEVFSATNSAEALSLAETQTPDMILLDRRLGEESGLELFKNLRAIAQTKTTPVFLLSNQDATAEDLAILKSFEPAEYLIKEHIDLNELSQKVQGLIGPA